MSTALGYLYNIYTAFLDIIFNQFAISTNVTIGWIFISIIIFGLMIQSILNIPKGVSFKKGKK